jgi:hypothetical protein
MSKSHRLAWAAGFLDGDGFITIQRRNQKVKDKVYENLYLRVGACQANKVPLLELQKIFGGSIRDKNSGPNHECYNRKQQYVWTLSTRQASDALQQLLPFLIHKKEVAILGIEFQETMQNNKQVVKEELKLLRELLKEKIKFINSLS